MDERAKDAGDRGSYCFIDAVVRHDAAAGIVCSKAFRGDEAYFAGHFPGHAIVPGVFELEMLFQAAARFLLLEGIAGAAHLRSVSSARFTSPIIPPREVTATASLKERRGEEWLFSGRVSDGPDTFVQASFTVQVVQP